MQRTHRNLNDSSRAPSESSGDEDLKSPSLTSPTIDIDDVDADDNASLSPKRGRKSRRTEEDEVRAQMEGEISGRN